MTDSELEDMEEVEVKREDLIEDGLKIDNDEWEVIKLPPKAAVFEKLEIVRMKCEAEIANCKQRWGRKL